MGATASSAKNDPECQQLHRRYIALEVEFESLEDFFDDLGSREEFDGLDLSSLDLVDFVDDIQQKRDRYDELKELIGHFRHSNNLLPAKTLSSIEDELKVLTHDLSKARAKFQYEYLKSRFVACLARIEVEDEKFKKLTSMGKTEVRLHDTIKRLRKDALDGYENSLMWMRMYGKCVRTVEPDDKQCCIVSEQ